MLSNEQMIEVAEMYLASITGEVECALSLKRMITKDYGKIFFYQSQKFFETLDFRDALVGNAPFLVKNENGQIIVFGTNESIEDYIEAYESGVWDPQYTIDDFMVK